MGQRLVLLTCDECHQPFTVNPPEDLLEEITREEYVELSKDKYGRVLCPQCRQTWDHIATVVDPLDLPSTFPDDELDF